MKRLLTVILIVVLAGIVSACGDGGTSDATANEKSISGNSESLTTAGAALTENEFAKLMFSIGSYCSSVTCAQKQYKKTMTCTSGTSAKGAGSAFFGATMMADQFTCDDWEGMNNANSAFLKTKEFCDQTFIKDKRSYSQNVEFATDAVTEFCEQTKEGGSTEINKALVSSGTSPASTAELVTQIFCHNVDLLLSDEQ